MNYNCEIDSKIRKVVNKIFNYFDSLTRMDVHNMIKKLMDENSIKEYNQKEIGTKE